MALRIHRVSVGGFFGELDDGTRARLLAAGDDHAPMAAAFTDDGTLTYEPQLTAYRLRVQLRSNEDDEATAETAAAERAIEMLVGRLAALGVEVRRSTLRVTVTDMASMWDRYDAPVPSDDERLEQAQRSRDVDDVAAAWLRGGDGDEWAVELVASAGVPYRMKAVEALVRCAADDAELARVGAGPLRALLVDDHGPVARWADRARSSSAAFAVAMAATGANRRSNDQVTSRTSR